MRARGPAGDVDEVVMVGPPVDARDGGASREPPKRETDLLQGAGVPAVPALAMPKGGGAVRGIGEKFQVNAVTGTGALTVPIGLSPGRLTPDLALRYDSGGGNGAFGLGWRLGVASIARRTDKRLPRYVDDGPDADVFVLAGAEDLVPALVGDDETGWRLDERDVDEDGTRWRVRRYRPRVEGDFARVERWTGPAGEHWRVTSRTNATTVFGRTDAARVADPDDARRVFEWLAEEHRDDHGNVISYGYVPEDTAGVDPAAAHEAHRVGRPQAARLLKRVRYANATPGVADDYRLELVVDYGDHDPALPTPQPDRPWPVRVDPFSSGRGGFEARTYRRAARLLMFHRFTDDPLLVHATTLDYRDAPTGSLLTTVTRIGYARRAGGGYDTPASLPPLVLTYTEAALDPTVRELDAVDARNLPVGLGTGYTFVDLDGEGLAGILTDQAGAWFYKRNLGGGRFGATTVVSPVPAPARLAAGQQLLDLDGDGRRELVSWRPGLPGYFARTDDGDWSPFAAFDRVPSVDPADPRHRLVDLNGDGRADLLVADDTEFTWYASAGRAGFDDYERVARVTDEEAGPVVGWPSPGAAEAVEFADMSGDGLPDLVRVRAAEVCYWPNLGYGRFGAKVTMSGAPNLAEPGTFDPKRVRLADIDGSGTTDLVYLHPDGVRLYLNGCGNVLRPGPALPDLPHLADTDDVSVVDLCGTGTGYLVWSTPLPADGCRTLRYVDLMGAKPYLLASVTDGLGAVTAMAYTPSTAFYRADVEAGTPWATRLPFPVHCLSRVEITDSTSDTRMVSEYTYHHGYFDRVEREFRGFARVEHTDAETFGAGPRSELAMVPVLTRQWFHTGVDPARGDGTAIVAAEGYRGDPSALRLPGPGMPTPADREAHRALKGQEMRTEVYGLDAPAVPYMVSEHAPVVRRIQPARPEIGAAHPVFQVCPGESLEHHYERDASDPRVTHALALEVDAYGTVTASASVAYPRRAGGGDHLDEQDVAAVTATRSSVTHVDTPDAYRLGVLTEAVTYELTGIAVGGDRRADATDLLATLDTAPVHGYLDAPGDGPARRAIEHVRLLYLDDGRTAPRPLGEVGRHGLVHETYARAFDATILATVYGTDVDAATLTGAGYASLAERAGLFPAGDDPSWWWRPSGQARYGPDVFDQPVAHVDPFGGATTIGYEPHALAVNRVVDAVGNAVTADLDYRALAPARIVDANGDATAAAYDALGRLAGTALLAAGDSLDGFAADPPPGTLRAHLATPLADPAGLLGAATTRVLYDLTATPTVAVVLSRERHADATSPIQQSFAYADGLGRELMRKARAEPGPAPWGDDGGALHVDPLRAADPRWVGTGRIVRNNKGLPVRRYEPFFSPTHAYETETQLVAAGVTPVLHYDPVGRVVRTDHPDGTFDTVAYTPWREVHADANDNVTGTAWLAAHLAATDGYEARSATLALAHADTPAVVHADPLGRPVRSVADNGGTMLVTSTALDIEGNHRAVTDARGVAILRTTFDMLGNALRTDSVDAGVHRVLPDALGQPRLEWTARGMRVRHEYDAARRPVEVWVAGEPGASAERPVTRIVWGDGARVLATTRAAGRLAGRVYQVHDEPGVVTYAEYDVHGAVRTAVRAFTGSPGEEFRSVTDHDALGRVVRHETAFGDVIVPAYNGANLLDSVTLTAPRGTPTALVSDIDYDAKGQRTAIAYGSGAATAYTYDPLTFRLTRLVTTAGGVPLQDLAYHDDPVGNVTAITDGAREDVFFRGAITRPAATYTYDPTYRLTAATGREHIGQADRDADASTGLRPRYDHSDATRRHLPHPNDATAMRGYTESYTYDPVGNLLALVHEANGGTWRRQHDYAAGTNRLRTITVPGDAPLDRDVPDLAARPDRFGYDAHGNTTAMPHLNALAWDHADRLAEVTLGATRTARYAYDAAGQRVHKAIVEDGVTVEERWYLGEVELYRRYSPATGEVTLERRTLHVLDGQHRMALVETKTVDRSDPGGLGRPATRYQHDNHLGSACLELDETAAVIGYEEFYPYGSTSYQAGRNEAETSLKRYRYTGKERDEETGFGYHGARYYAPWLARWTSPDPAGLVDGPNVYAYTRANPIRLIDPTGHESEKPKQLSFAELRSFARDVTATYSGRGFTTEIKTYFRKLAQQWGDLKQLYDISHLDKPFVLTKQGESSAVGLEPDSVNRQKAAGEAQAAAEAREKKQFAREIGTGADKTGKKGKRNPRLPVPAAAARVHAFEPAQPAPPAAAPAATPAGPATAPPVPKPPQQLELQFNQPSPAAASSPARPPSLAARVGARLSGIAQRARTAAANRLQSLATRYPRIAAIGGGLKQFIPGAEVASATGVAYKAGAFSAIAGKIAAGLEVLGAIGARVTIPIPVFIIPPGALDSGPGRRDGGFT